MHYACYIVRLQAYHSQHVKGPARFFSGTHAVSAMIALARKHLFQPYLGHKNIQYTVGYTVLAAECFQGLWSD